jgi:hypothetical protein
MVYFANKYYKSGSTRVYDQTNSLYSLKTLPPGIADIPVTETPPLYDLVVAIAVLENMSPGYLEISNIREVLMDYVRWIE